MRRRSDGDSPRCSHQLSRPHEPAAPPEAPLRVQLLRAARGASEELEGHPEVADLGWAAVAQGGSAEATWIEGDNRLASTRAARADAVAPAACVGARGLEADPESSTTRVAEEDVADGRVHILERGSSMRGVSKRPRALASLSLDAPSSVDVAAVVHLLGGVLHDAVVDADALLVDAGMDSTRAAIGRSRLQRAVGAHVALTGALFERATARQLSSAPALCVGRARLPLPSDASALPWALLGFARCSRTRACSVPRDPASQQPATTASRSLRPAGTRARCKTGSALIPSKRVGGFVRGAQLFDNLSFRLSPAEASATDPTAAHAIEHC